ncbi:MAG: hypothetical protein GF311_21695 [Candidatus Lokiarchaeota archaeon]|nr:hypothetical protein [Candidatus Lokiarchaeota archaeon]
MQKLELKKNENITVKETNNSQKIQYAFEKLLFVPETQLKPRIIFELVQYLNKKIKDENYPIKVFIAKEGRIIKGIVVCQIDPDYRSYGRKCGTFGWLYALTLESCKHLMNHCEKYMKEYRIRKLRGPINYPKLIGGIGFQTKGFDHTMMAGVNFHDPNMRELVFLEHLGYKRESKYSCVKVFNTEWNKGKQIPNDIIIHFPTLTEFKNLKEEILELGKKSFNAILADAAGGEDRMQEFFKIFEILNNILPQQYKANNKRNPEEFTSNKTYIKTINSHDFSKNLPWLPFLFSKEDNQIIGLGVILPNLYQLWKGEVLTDANVDSVIIHPNHTNKGLFSTGFNAFRIAISMQGISYLEGTTIWSNNERAVNTIFPHSTHVREHVVLQKRI